MSEEPLKILDMACGTGDISFRILEKAKKDSQDEGSLSVSITLSDNSPHMIEVCKKQAVERGIFHDLQFQVMNGEKLDSIPDDSIDMYVSGFGIRHILNQD